MTDRNCAKSFIAFTFFFNHVHFYGWLHKGKDKMKTTCKIYIKLARCCRIREGLGDKAFKKCWHWKLGFLGTGQENLTNVLKIQGKMGAARQGKALEMQ